MMTEMDLAAPTSTSAPHELSPDRLEDRPSYRKSNKPMMEKKRRARINSSLTQLKSLVLQAMKKDNSQYSKLEKADILELTVKHLKDVERYQARGALGQQPDAMSKYRAGFNECANEVIRYLAQSQGVNADARSRIVSHLANILTPINSLPLQQTHTPILPAPAPPASAPQQQQLHQLQQHFHLQQHPQSAPYLSAASHQTLHLDNNNNKPVIKLEPSFVSQTPNLLKHQEALNLATVKTNTAAPDGSSPPTAFQAPICSNSMVQTAEGNSGLPVPCIATTPMGTAQFQLVPSTLPTGQVTLVLAPQSVSALNMNVYAQQANQRSILQETPMLTADNHISVVDEAKARLSSNESPVSLVVKPSSRSPKPAIVSARDSARPLAQTVSTRDSSHPLPHTVQTHGSVSPSRVSPTVTTYNIPTGHGSPTVITYQPPTGHSSPPVSSHQPTTRHNPSPIPTYQPPTGHNSSPVPTYQPPTVHNSPPIPTFQPATGHNSPPVPTYQPPTVHGVQLTPAGTRSTPPGTSLHFVDNSITKGTFTPAHSQTAKKSTQLSNDDPMWRPW